jgi:hypothetical protein
MIAIIKESVTYIKGSVNVKKVGLEMIVAWI